MNGLPGQHLGFFGYDMSGWPGCEREIIEAQTKASNENY